MPDGNELQFTICIVYTTQPQSTPKMIRQFLESNMWSRA